jgi:hypothetical protein
LCFECLIYLSQSSEIISTVSVEVIRNLQVAVEESHLQENKTNQAIDVVTTILASCKEISLAHLPDVALCGLQFLQVLVDLRLIEDSGTPSLLRFTSANKFQSQPLFLDD